MWIIVANSISSLRSTIGECDSVSRARLWPLHSPPKPGWGVCVSPRWSQETLTGHPSSLLSLLKCVAIGSTGNHPSVRLPPSISCHPLPSTFNLLGIIDSVFFSHLIFSLLLFMTFKPVLDRSRPQRQQREERIGYVSWVRRCVVALESTDSMSPLFPHALGPYGWDPRV